MGVGVFIYLCFFFFICLFLFPSIIIGILVYVRLVLDAGSDMDEDTVPDVNEQGDGKTSEHVPSSTENEFNKIPFNQLCSLFERLQRAKSKL